MSAPVLEASGNLFDEDEDLGDEDAHGATTKIGPLSQAVVDQIMRDAEARAPEASPASKIAPAVKATSQTAQTTQTTQTTRPPPPPATDLPVLSDEDYEDDAEPTLLNPRAHALGSVSVHAVATTSSTAAASVVDAIVDEIASTYSADAAAEEAPDDCPTLSPPSGAFAASSSIAAAPRSPRPAAFPEWLGVTFRPDAHNRNDGLLVAIAAGAGAVVVVAFLLWALFR